MKNYKGLKKILLVMVALCAVLCMKNFVNAADYDVDIRVKSNGKEYRYGVPENSYYSYFKDKPDTVSYDIAKHELTLNNFVGDSIDIYIETESVSTFTIKLIGNNRITRDLGKNIDGNLIRIIDYYNYRGKPVDFKFVGNGTLKFESKNQTVEVIDATEANLIIDGPTINIVDCNCGEKARYVEAWDSYVYESHSAIEACGLIMKSGKLNMQIWPSYRQGNEEPRFDYGNAILIYNPFGKGKMSTQGGLIDITYNFPSDEYNGEKIVYDNAIAIKNIYEKISTDRIKLHVADKIKGKIKLIPENRIDFIILVKDGDKVKAVTDPNKVKGLKWDSSKYVLTMDGYNGGDIIFGSPYYHEKVTVVVKNSNELKHIRDSEIEKLIGVDRRGFWGENVDITFTGTGKFKINDVIVAESMWGSEKICQGNNLDNMIIIDGPSIEVKEIAYCEFFKMKSGRLTCNDDYGPFITARKDFKITGGTIVVDASEADNDYCIVAVASDAKVLLEGGAIVVIGSEYYYPESNKSVAGVYNFYDNQVYCGSLVSEFADVVKKDAYASMYKYKSSAGTPISISKIKLSIPKSEYVYTGKEIKPKVSLGGLREGEDFVVDYNDNVKIGTAKIVISGIGFYSGTKTINFSIVKKNNSGKSSNGKTNVKYKKLLYRVVSEAKSGSKYGKVELVGSVNKKCKKITIPKVVKINNKKYRVVSIAKKAFADCKKLKKVIIKSTSIKKIGKKAFAGKKKITIKVPKKKKKAYKKLLKKAKIKCKIK